MIYNVFGGTEKKKGRIANVADCNGLNFVKAVGRRPQYKGHDTTDTTTKLTPLRPTCRVKLHSTKAKKCRHTMTSVV